MQECVRIRPAWALFLLLAAALQPPEARAQAFVTTRLDGEAGFDSNRDRDREGTNAWFLAATPAVEWDWFATELLELNAGLQYRDQQYVAPASSAIRDGSGFFGGRYHRGQVEVDLYLGAGAYRDTAVPDDDNRWGQMEPAVYYTLENGITPSLAGRWTHSRYDSYLTYAGELEVGNYWNLRPGLLWPVNAALSAWGEVYLEQYTANEPSDEYHGYGGSLGLDADLDPRWLLSASASYGWQNYPQGQVDPQASIRYQPYGADLRLRYRAADWCDLWCAGFIDNQASTDHGSEYSAWGGSLGISLARDFAWPW